MKVLSIVALGLFLLSSPAFAVDPVATIISQPNAPLRITSYKAYYSPGGNYALKGIHHSVEFKNTGKSDIVAVQIGLVSFDIWNEFLDKTGGVSMEGISPGDDESGEWVARAYGEFAFHTGFAYVSKVRFEDGKIWEANLSLIAEQMRKIERDFDVEKLKGTNNGKDEGENRGG